MCPELEYSLRGIEEVNNSELSAETKKQLIDDHVQEVKKQLSLILENE